MFFGMPCWPCCGCIAVQGPFVTQQAFEVCHGLTKRGGDAIATSVGGRVGDELNMVGGAINATGGLVNKGMEDGTW